MKLNTTKRNSKTSNSSKPKSSIPEFKLSKNKILFWKNTFQKLSISSTLQINVSVRAISARKRSICLRTSSSTKVESFRKSRSNWANKCLRNSFLKTSETRKISLLKQKVKEKLKLEQARTLKTTRILIMEWW